MAGKSFVFRFADVEVREREFSLVKAGEVLAVEPKAFRVLLMLLRNPQKLIAKEELLNAVWGDAAVTENSLTRSIALLRKLLGDEARDPRFIETVATVGYRFVSKVEVSEDDSGPHEEGGDGKDLGLPVPAPPSPGRRWGWVMVAGGVLALCLAGAVWYLHRPLPPPRITGYTQITRDGHEKRLSGTDGSRLYFTQMQPKSLNQVGVAGGEVAQIPAAVPGIFYMLDVSPDGSNLLVASLESGSDERSLWIVRALGGTSRHIANGGVATFSPDGNTIAYSTNEGELWLIRSDGTGNHKLASIGSDAEDLNWSPDGKAIRFSRDGVLWEILADGSSLHEVLPGWQYRGRECCGRWTADGRFYVFLTSPTNYRGDQIWALDERRGLFRRSSAEPVQLTTGPIRLEQSHSRQGHEHYLCRWQNPSRRALPFRHKDETTRAFSGGNLRPGCFVFQRRPVRRLCLLP